MKYYYINTDSTEFERSPHAEWIEYDYAFTSGAPRNSPDFEGDYRQFGEEGLGKLEPDDICFMYVNGYGVVAIGKVAAPWNGCAYQGDDRWIYKDTDATEYRIPVYWFHTLVDYPISTRELRRIFGWGPNGWPWQSTLGIITNTDDTKKLLNLAEKREPESIQRGIREVISKIEKKSANGDYIYRGEPEHHTKVSSTLYRRYGQGDDVKHLNFNIETIQTHILREGKRYLREENDLEILTQLQHYGGRTNLIDFTNDYLISLFFACDGIPHKSGRVILLDRNKMEKDHIKEPHSPIKRVRDQKSVFVTPPDGFIGREKYKTINVPKYLKEAILDHIEKYHYISANRVYDDLHGLIRIQKLHEHAYIEYFKGVTYHVKNQDSEAIKHYTKAIELHHGHVEAHNNRGVAYHHQGDHDSAIADCTRAIELDRSYAYAYHNRGLAYGGKGEYSLAITDFTEAIELNRNDPDTYHSRGRVYSKKCEYSLAIADLTKAIELNRNDANVHNDRGAAYQGIGEYSLAIADYTRAIELDDNLFIAYRNRGIARLHLAEFKEAESDLQTAKQNGLNVINIFDAIYGSIAQFQDKTGIMLPESIVEVLTATPS